ncbi:hypothetical protein [Pseudaminobacter soli (ex Li et al. 2025)]|uniref:hypothetical protein n=1 Tax=Pseudaminobacter soli (ex Li et al. 2025) TaxID=1295366 RepID=UPI002473B030|nr:hypothetical protein [Mesorhizobium soli]
MNIDHVFRLLIAEVGQFVLNLHLFRVCCFHAPIEHRLNADAAHEQVSELLDLMVQFTQLPLQLRPLADFVAQLLPSLGPRILQKHVDVLGR